MTELRDTRLPAAAEITMNALLFVGRFPHGKPALSVRPPRAARIAAGATVSLALALAAKVSDAVAAALRESGFEVVPPEEFDTAWRRQLEQAGRDCRGHVQDHVREVVRVGVRER